VFAQPEGGIGVRVLALVGAEFPDACCFVSEFLLVWLLRVLELDELDPEL